MKPTVGVLVNALAVGAGLAPLVYLVWRVNESAGITAAAGAAVIAFSTGWISRWTIWR